MKRLSDNGNTVIEAGPDSAPNRIANVADGINPNDAVNVEQLNAVAPNRKIYKVTLTQSATGTPKETILTNTLSGTPVYSRNGAGDYVATLAGEFPADKTFVIIGSGRVAGKVLEAWRIDESTIAIKTASTDGYLTETAFLIEVYP